ncbi:MAG: hypothetical protein CVU84_16820 [Firmicutes bacterium HGW-Firmicutes-1]|jgi:hypothetical protein|nr:MAG: hypothetical protein CVU84_16820 [Firmicutes bacterium HGW-Firmicutes-1]
MTSLYLSDILKRNGFDLNRVKLIRHSLKDKNFKKCYENEFMDEYQKLQKEKFFNGCDYILSFISEPGSSAKFAGCYEVGRGELAVKALIPEGFPVESMFNDELFRFDLMKIDLLSDLIGRLIIDWGKAAISWHQWATNEKAVLAIQENPRLAFNGFENVVLSYGELKEIIKDATLYENWHTALSSIYAIYLVVDQTDGKQYVGSAYGAGGLLARWKCYVDTKHGGNKGLKEVICNYSERYHQFQFSILQILPKNISDQEVISFENLFKRKLLSKEFGMNEN